MRKLILTTVGVGLLLAGCVLKKARVESPAKVVVGAVKPGSRCEYLGETRGNHQNFQGYSSAKKNQEMGAFLEAKSQAAELGGNYVAKGSIYKCPEIELKDLENGK